MNNYIGMLNNYLANVFVLNKNLYNLHWNVVGPFFFTWHEKLQEYYEFTNEVIDEVAERIKMLEGYPYTTLTEYMENSNIESLESKDYDEKDVLRILITEFTYMKELTKQVGDYVTTINDLYTIDLMTEYIKFFEKQLWMLKANII